MIEPTAGASSTAAIVVVAADELDLQKLVARLERRYGTDYAVIGLGSGADAVARLSNLRDTGREVAIVLADHRLRDMSGIAFLARVQPLHSGAKRALLVSAADAWGADPAATKDFVRAAALGAIDAFIQKPVVEPDEQFHLAIAEFLEQWARTHRPRYALIQIVGDQWSEMSHNFRDHLARVALPFDFYTPDSPEGRALLERAGRPGPLPIAILHDGRIFVRPSALEIVAALGLDPSGQRAMFDVAIVGGGPAGLAAAVNAASEGLSVAVVEGEVVGGQAGTTSLVRNYLGFPHGVSGADLAHRAFMQARFFGAQFLIARVVTGLRTEGDTHVLTLDDASEVAAQAVLLAMGVSYRRMEIPSIDALLGRGVYYGAATTEAAGLLGEDVFVVGGANSAGQAAVHLARFAAHVTLVVRGPSLAAGMSDYLVREIAVHPNLTVRLSTEIAEARTDGEGRLRAAVLRDRTVGTAEEMPAAAIFALIGSAPRTAWLPETVMRDPHGFVLTGTALGSDARASGASPFGTSLAGTFAVGDVRAHSIKRVASAVGEGSAAIRFVHEYLAAQRFPVSS
jgi:thioredoxin reductase (NADPH)